MKINKSAGFIMAVCVTLLFFSSCKDKKELLTRTWKVQDITQEIEPLEEQKVAIEAWKAGMRDSFTITYGADGTYKSNFKGSEILGKWKLNYNSTNLEVTTSNNDTKTYKIKELTAAKFTFIAKMESGDVTFVMIPK